MPAKKEETRILTLNIEPNDEAHPLCDECNNFKSTSCRGCQLECEQCSWAFPERFAPLRLSSDNISKLRQFAINTNSDPHDLLNQIVDEFFQTKASEAEE